LLWPFCLLCSLRNARVGILHVCYVKNILLGGSNGSMGIVTGVVLGVVLTTLFFFPSPVFSQGGSNWSIKIVTGVVLSVILTSSFSFPPRFFQGGSMSIGMVTGVVLSIVLTSCGFVAQVCVRECVLCVLIVSSVISPSPSLALALSLCVRVCVYVCVCVSVYVCVKINIHEFEKNFISTRKVLCERQKKKDTRAERGAGDRGGNVRKLGRSFCCGPHIIKRLFYIGYLLYSKYDRALIFLYKYFFYINILEGLFPLLVHSIYISLLYYIVNIR
jgi:hypothetical protein